MSPRTITYQPTKKPKGKELTAEQKEQNRRFSKEYIRVEHSIGGVKAYLTCFLTADSDHCRMSVGKGDNPYFLPLLGRGRLQNAHYLTKPRF